MEVKIEAAQAKKISSYYSVAAEERDVSLGYKWTEVGVIPQDWEITRLGRICSMKSGIGITSASIDEFSTYPCFGGNGIRGFTDRFTHSGRFPLIGRQGALCGNIVLAEGKFFASEHAIIVTASTKTDTDWLFFVLDRMHLNEFSESSAQPGLSVSKILLLPVACPPLLEQRAIAKALSDADALIESLEQLFTKKRQIKKGAMQELLTGTKRLPGFRGKWEAKRLGEFVSIRNQKVLPSCIDLDTPCVELDHIGQGDGRLVECSTAQHSTSSKYRFFTGDVLFGRLRSYLRKFWLADRDGICSTEIWPLVVDSAQAERGFLFAVVQSDRFIATASISYGTHMPRADWDVMCNFPVRLPKVEEQAAIATILADMDTEIAALEAKRSKARQIKQGMMQELLTGRIRLI